MTLGYPPEGETRGSTAFAADAGSPSDTTIVIHLVPFSDQRSDKTLIGEVRNGWGMKTADVITQNSVSEWITNALGMELQDAGFAVKKTLPGDQPSPTGTVVSGEIVTVYCKAFMTHEGEVSFFATVTKDGREILRRRYSSEGSAGLNWAATSRGYGKTLELALKNSLQQLTDELRFSLSTA